MWLLLDVFFYYYLQLGDKMRRNKGHEESWGSMSQENSFKTHCKAGAALEGTEHCLPKDIPSVSVLMMESTRYRIIGPILRAIGPSWQSQKGSGFQEGLKRVFSLIIPRSNPIFTTPVYSQSSRTIRVPIMNPLSRSLGSFPRCILVHCQGQPGLFRFFKC